MTIVSAKPILEILKGEKRDSHKGDFPGVQEAFKGPLVSGLFISLVLKASVGHRFRVVDAVDLTSNVLGLSPGALRDHRGCRDSKLAGQGVAEQAPTSCTLLLASKTCLFVFACLFV